MLIGMILLNLIILFDDKIFYKNLLFGDKIGDILKIILFIN
jgi:hypothetical protein